MQFVQLVFLKFIPHILVLVKYKIIWLDVQKYNFQIFLLFAIELAVLSVFWQKKGFGLLGFKDRVYKECQTL